MTNPGSEPAAAAPSSATFATTRTGFWLYMTGVATWFVGLAIQFVLFPGLVALVLHAPAVRVGIAQTAILLPMLFFLLPAGALADRLDARRIIITVQAMAIVPPLVLALLIREGLLSYGLLIGYALFMGTLSAIISPAREGLVARIAGSNLQRAVTTATGMQYGVQVLGFLIVYLLADRFGLTPVLLLQSLLYLVGVIAFQRLHLPPHVPAASSHATLQLIGDGFRVMFASDRLRAVSALNFALGVCYMGVFLVAIPLLVRDVYNGTQSDIALTSMANTSGTIIATATLLAVGAVRLKGRVLLSSLVVSACAIALMGAKLPFGVLLAVITLSGIAGGVGLIMGRTLALENAPHTHRSRVMAIYMLAIMGGAPVGSLLTGFAATHLGAHGALIAAAAAIGLTVLITATSSRLASA